MSKRHRDCRKVDALLEAYVDGDLGSPDSGFVERHLDICPECRHQAEQADLIRSGLERLPQRDCPDGVLHEVYERIESGETGYVVAPVRLWTLVRPKLYFPIASGLVLAVVAALLRPFACPDRDQGRTAACQAEAAIVFAGEVTRASVEKAIDQTRDQLAPQLDKTLTKVLRGTLFE